MVTRETWTRLLDRKMVQDTEQDGVLRPTERQEVRIHAGGRDYAIQGDSLDASLGRGQTLDHSGRLYLVIHSTQETYIAWEAITAITFHEQQ